MTYKDLTIVIPIRIDSEDRFRNLQIVVDDLTGFDVAEIIILEADETSKISELKGVRTHFVKDCNRLFYRTHYINQLCAMTNTKYVGVWDSDVVIDSSQIATSMELLRSGVVDMVIPYDGRFFDIRHDLLNEFITNRDISALIDAIPNMTPIYGNMSCGGAFIVDKEAYVSAGGENEKFRSWGPEDLERYKRWEIKGYRVKRIDGAIFHLNHHIGDNSKYFDFKTKKEAFQTLLETCRESIEYYSV